jgi:hypothetical protein
VDPRVASATEGSELRAVVSGHGSRVIERFQWFSLIAKR